MEFHHYSQQRTIFSSAWRIINHRIGKKKKSLNLICKPLLRVGSYFALDNITKQCLPLTVYQIEFSSLTMKGKAASSRGHYHFESALLDKKQLSIWKCFDQSQ